MTLSPFVFQRGIDIVTSTGVSCFDEASPCILEQISACVIKLTNDHTKYVPWLICMDTNGETTENAATCSAQVGLDYAQVSSCQSEQGMDLLQALLQHDSQVHSTPTVFVNGANVDPNSKEDPTYEQIHSAFCKADPSLKACGSIPTMVV
mmetsp:Transcript_25274/g.84394  ORF Transcript_25274/g.84394 Transcript_25274/m.84394 type:complete len:150 (+) Transcript_25274:231-680(+)